MKILFTGASSLTGMWFVLALAEAGHEVTAIYSKDSNSYEGVRLQRIQKLLPICQSIFSCPFGSEQFQSLISQQRWDLLCHHAADVTNYRSSNFDYAKALANNTCNLERTLRTLQQQGCNRVLLTGSVFEKWEGTGTDGLRAVSPYGLSKGLTADVFSYFTATLQMSLGKFVIPNPFGPYEEGRFTTYLIDQWFSGKTATVNTPEYVRDNIHTNLLAKAYVFFAETLSPDPGFQKLNPSCYAESQGAFTARFANEMRERLSLPCAYELKTQLDFPEPKVRINTDVLDHKALGWDEKIAWDDLADYYQSVYMTKVTHD